MKTNFSLLFFEKAKELCRWKCADLHEDYRRGKSCGDGHQS